MVKHAGILPSMLFCAMGGSCPAQDSASQLARILAGKGVIDAAELARVEAASPESRVQMLASLLEKKGVLTQAELVQLTPQGADRPTQAGRRQLHAQLSLARA